MQTPPRPPKRKLERSIFSEGPKQYASELAQMSVPSKIARRKLEQGTSNPEQCEGVGAQKSECWICGNVLDFSIKTYPLQPECDHILPITQTDLFLDLYRKSDPTHITDAMRMAYGWTHAVCNRIKNNQTFLNTTDPNNLKIDDSKLQSFLLNLKPNFPSLNIEQRQIAMRQKLEPVITYINSRGTGLSLLSTVASKLKGGNIQMQGLFNNALDYAKQQGSTAFVQTLKNNEPLIETQVVGVLEKMDAPSRDAVVDHLSTLATNVRAKFPKGTVTSRSFFESRPATAGRRLQRRKRTNKHKTRRHH